MTENQDRVAVIMEKLDTDADFFQIVYDSTGKIDVPAMYAAINELAEDLTEDELERLALEIAQKRLGLTMDESYAISALQQIVLQTFDTQVPPMRLLGVTERVYDLFAMWLQTELSMLDQSLQERGSDEDHRLLSIGMAMFLCGVVFQQAFPNPTNSGESDGI